MRWMHDFVSHVYLFGNITNECLYQTEKQHSPTDRLLVSTYPKWWIFLRNSSAALPMTFNISGTDKSAQYLYFFWFRVQYSTSDTESLSYCDKKWTSCNTTLVWNRTHSGMEPVLLIGFKSGRSDRTTRTGGVVTEWKLAQTTSSCTSNTLIERGASLSSPSLIDGKRCTIFG